MAKIAGKFKAADKQFGARRGRTSNYGAAFGRFDALAQDAGFEDELILEPEEDETSAKNSLRNALGRHAKQQKLGAGVGFDTAREENGSVVIPYTVYKIAARPARVYAEGKKPGRPKGASAGKGNDKPAQAKGGAARR